jgi:hypothetical protein
MDLKNENAKYLIEQISQKAFSLTNLRITKASFSTKENEWRAYIHQAQPHWEDVAWRVKLNENNTEGQIQLTLFSSKPPFNFSQILDSIEELASSNQFSKTDIRTEKSIAIGWTIEDLENGYMTQVKIGHILMVLDQFLRVSLEYLVKNGKARTNQKSNAKSDAIIMKANGDKFELSSEDHPVLIDWYEAKNFEQINGDGWRLPTLDELLLVYNEVHKTDKQKFNEDKSYWTCEEIENSKGMANAFYFDYGQKFEETKDYKTCARFVRDVNQ